MKQKNKILKTIMVLIAAWGIIPLAYLSWCFFTVGYINSSIYYIGAITGVVAFTAYLVVMKIMIKQYPAIEREAVGVNVGILIASMMVGTALLSECDGIVRILAEVVVVSAIVAAMFLLVNSLKEHDFLMDLNAVKKHLGIIILVGIVIVLSIDTNAFQIKWDGLLYYDAVKQSNLGSISSVALYGHVAISSGAYYRLWGVLCKNICQGMMVANITLLVGAVIAFYKALKCMVKDRSELVYCAVTACFAFSPFLLGMVDYYSTDWFCVCTVIILFYSIVNRRWMGTVIFACIFVLSKEPALIAYAGLCLGLLIEDFSEKDSLKKNFVKVLSSIHYYFMLLPFIIWFGTYKILGQWSAGSGGFEIDLAYILNKSKVFLILNFNWIFTIMILVGLVLVIAKKIQVVNGMWPIIMSNLFLWIFNFAFKTANHPRYIDSFVSLHILLAGVFLLEIILNRKMLVALSCMVAILGLVSCYITIDPVSKVVFEHNNVGKVDIITTSEHLLGDGSIYNKQMLWMEGAYTKAIREALEQGDSVVIPTSNDSIYVSDGMSEYIFITGDFQEDSQYWDEVKAVRVPYASEFADEAEKITVYHINDKAFVDEQKYDKEEISIVYIKGINDYAVSDGTAVIGSKDYTYRGWTVTRDIVKLDKKNR